MCVYYLSYILPPSQVQKDDIQVTFREVTNDKIVWEQAADVVMVHHQHAMIIRTPKYTGKTLEVSDKAAYYQLGVHAFC